MNFFDWANAIFTFHPTIAIAMLAFFIVPILRTTMFAFRCESSFSIHITGFVGRWEYAIGWIRNTLGVAYLIGAVFWNTYLWIITARETVWNISALMVICSISLLVINEAYRTWKRKDMLALLEFVRRHPGTYPAEFFSYYYATHGPIGLRLPKEPKNEIDPLHIDFRPHRKKTSVTIWPMFRAIYRIMIITRLINFASKWKDGKFARLAASGLAVIGATNMLKLAQAEFKIEDIKKLEDVKMPMMYCFNHTSALDFNLAALLLFAHKRTADIEMPLLPCFLLAKDHFLDNPFLYRVLGLGRAAEILGMIFVERKRRTRESTNRIVSDAVDRLIRNMPIAIYPQGTRARSKVSAEGKRMDGSYYAVGSFQRLTREGGHLKKGAAFIATNAALSLNDTGRNEPFNLIPVVFIGAANVVQRKGIRTLRGESVTMRVGDPITLTPDMISNIAISDDEEEGSTSYSEFVDSLHKRVDDSLKTTLRVHAELERRFFEDMRSGINHLKMEELSIAMKQWRRDDYLVYAILDFIYTCRPKEWISLLGQLAHLILNDAPRDDYLKLKEQVAKKLTKKS